MQDGRKNLPMRNQKKRGKGEKNTNKSGEERRTYVQHQINAQVNEDICLAAPPVRVNFFIHALLLPPAKCKLFACILFLYLTSPFAAPSPPALHQHTMHASLCCFCLPLLPPSLHLPTINFSVLH
jgi:hypothetical protein